MSFSDAPHDTSPPGGRYPGTVPSLLYVTNATTGISDSQQQRLLLPPPDALVAVASSGGGSGVSVLSPRGRCACAGGTAGGGVESVKENTAAFVVGGRLFFAHACVTKFMPAMSNNPYRCLLCWCCWYCCRRRHHHLHGEARLRYGSEARICPTAAGWRFTTIATGPVRTLHPTP